MQDRFNTTDRDLLWKRRSSHVRSNVRRSVGKLRLCDNAKNAQRMFLDRWGYPKIELPSCSRLRGAWRLNNSLQGARQSCQPRIGESV
jgi:hypothetical protein